MINISVNTQATYTFRESLSEHLNTIHGMFGLGALVGPLMLALSLQLFNSLVFAYTIGVVITLIALVLAMQQAESNPPAEIHKYTRAPGTPSSTLRGVLRQRLLWLMVLQISLYASAEIGFGNWIVTAVSQSAQISLALAAPVATAFYLGLTAGRLGGAHLLKRARVSETRLLYIATLGGALAGLIVAIFPGQLLIAYIGSVLLGCFYGPLFPCIMSITSRRFKQSVGPVSSIMMIGNSISTMIVPAAMGSLIPLLGMNQVIGVPALLTMAIVLPMALANRASLQTTLLPERPRNEVETSSMS